MSQVSPKISRVRRLVYTLNDDLGIYGAAVVDDQEVDKWREALAQFERIQGEMELIYNCWKREEIVSEVEDDKLQESL